MSALTRARARGAAYVEVLVIVGVVLVLGLLAVNTLGRSSSEQADKEAACIKSFACAGGSAGVAGSPNLGSMAGTASGSNGGSPASSSSSTGGVGSGGPSGNTPASGVLNQTGRFLGGVVDGAKDLVVGLGTLAFAATLPGMAYYEYKGQSNPLFDAVAGLAKLAFYASPPGQLVTMVTGNDPIGDLGKGIKNAVVASWKADPARTFGRGVFEAVGLFGPGAVAKIGDVAKVAELAKAAEIAKATELAKAAELAEGARTAEAARAADQAARASEAARAAERAEAARTAAATAEAREAAAAHFNDESLGHALDRHSPHRPPAPGATKGTLFPRAWSEDQFKIEAERIANDPSIARVPVPLERGGVGWTKEAPVTINGETRIVRVIGEVPDPAIPGTGPGRITSAYPPFKNR